jgi:hypothetical protein
MVYNDLCMQDSSIWSNSTINATVSITGGCASLFAWCKFANLKELVKHGESESGILTSTTVSCKVVVTVSCISSFWSLLVAVDDDVGWTTVTSAIISYFITSDSTIIIPYEGQAIFSRIWKTYRWYWAETATAKMAKTEAKVAFMFWCMIVITIDQECLWINKRNEWDDQTNL